MLSLHWKERVNSKRYMRAFTKLNWGNKVSVSIYNTCTSVTNRNHRLLCACSMCSIAFDRKKGDVNVWRHVKTCEDMRWRVKVVNANNFHWSLLHMNEEPDPSLTCLWSFGPFANSPHVFLLLRVLLMRWDGFKYFWLACRSQIRQRISLSGNRKKGAHVTGNKRTSHEYRGLP